MMRRVPAVIGVVGLLALTMEGAGAAPVPTASPYPVPTIIPEVGIALDLPGPADVPQVGQDEAIQTAARVAGSLGTLGNPFSVQLVLLTDPNFGPDGGPRVIDHRLVWLVRMTGVPQPVYGGFDFQTGKAQAALLRPNEIATELNVVIDAVTGDHLESFSYR